MGKLAVAIFLILFGLVMLLRGLQLFPENFFLIYQELADRYWPVLLILLGTQILLRDRARRLAGIIGGVIFWLIGMWIVCHFWARPEWFNV
jgi:dolichol kinase